MAQIAEFVPRRSMSRSNVKNNDRYVAQPSGSAEQATPNYVEDRETKVIRANDTAVFIPEI